MTNFNHVSEEDIKFQKITPALENKWEKSLIKLEYPITDGKILIEGNVTRREKPKAADYMLFLNPHTPIAVVEAKSDKKSVSFGMQQAKTYAQMMNIPFAYSSNGDGFQEFDFFTGIEKTISLDEFPTMEELKRRWIEESKLGENELNLTEEQFKIIEQPFYTNQNTFDPRYYQRNAILRTVKAIAKGQKRVLLVMATGTGKTYTAFQIIWRLLKSGLVKKVLYLADRNILVDQSIQQDFKPLEKVTHKINFNDDLKKGLGTLTSYQMYFSLYQQLASNDNEETENETEHFKMLFPNPNYFDLVVVDECHRGSAKADSSWRDILEYFSSSIQIGMTATPKETAEVSSIDYFGKPVYEYSLNQGIEDGFLAPFRVHKITTNIGEGWQPTANQKDKNGNEIPNRIYNNKDYDYNIIIEDRIEEVAQKITDYMKLKNKRFAKTIVFCANEEHAERMRIALNNLNSDITKEHPDYVVRITASDKYGKSKLSYFIGTSEECRFPVIATTSELLSTGVDTKMVQLIVLDKMISSMIQFKQIIGRGTRIREKEGKLSFAVMDFRNVTNLFHDPAWDGDIEQVEGFQSYEERFDEEEKKTKTIKEEVFPLPQNAKPIVDKTGCKVSIINEQVLIYDANGKLLRNENIIDYTKRNIIDEYADLSTFIKRWTSEEKKKTISDLFGELGIDFEKLKSDKNMNDVDDFDFICHIAFDKKPLTRKERAENVKKRDFINKYNEQAREVLDILLERYKNEGIYDIENPKVFGMKDFEKFGKPMKIATLFGGKNELFNALKELTVELYAA